MAFNLEIDTGSGETVRIAIDGNLCWQVGDELLLRQVGDGFEIENTRTRDRVPVVVESDNPYGLCPHCGAEIVKRERRINGNDTCKSGHVFPSASSIKE